MDSFVQSFLQETGSDPESSQGGIVKPGSYILFCVEGPVRGDKGAFYGAGVAVGVTSKDRLQDDHKDVESSGNEEGPIVFQSNQFGVASSTGLYMDVDGPGILWGLDPQPPKKNPQKKDPRRLKREAALHPYKTKIDVPGAFLRFKTETEKDNAGGEKSEQSEQLVGGSGTEPVLGETIISPAAIPNP
jgi:hypothetical protein